jgi:uncharacterized protein (DUF362 family)/Pyruvate/2-oxoacid:ferredoxin oxidoreductase delta subunit
MDHKTGPRVVLADASYDNAVEVIEGLVERFPISWNGKRVLLKPNILAGWPPEKGVTTHPSIVEGAMRALERRGARVSIGDNPGAQSYGASERAAVVSGIRAVAGDRWVDLGRNAVKVKVDSRHFDHLLVSKEVLEADIVVNLPKLKTHALTTISGAIKNMFGILVGGQKARVHAACRTVEDFGEALVDIYQVRIPQLTIMDAVVGMEGMGPTGGRLRQVNRIIASLDGVAVDTVFAAMIGLPPERIGTLRAARQRGLGPRAISEIEVQGDMPLLRRFRLPVTVIGEDRAGRIAAWYMMSHAGTPRFALRRDRCTRCGTCAQGCPTAAIEMKGFPAWDYSRCIGCYCCIELCEQDAIRIPGRITGLFRR